MSALASAHFQIEIVKHFQIALELPQAIEMLARLAFDALVMQAPQAITTTKPALTTMFVHGATDSHRGKNNTQSLKLVRFLPNHQ